MTLRSSTMRPALERPFEVTLIIAVRERVSHVRNVFLPSFGMGAEELGDVRDVALTPAGTIYRETLRLVAHASGTLVITPGYLDAIDGRDGKPKRFLSNGLRLVAGTPQARLPWKALAAAVGIVMVGALGAAGAIARARRTNLVPPVSPPVEARGDLDDAFSRAREELRVRRDRTAVMNLREIVWASAGARRGATLCEVLGRPEASPQPVARLLLALERAAFTADADLAGAIDDVLAC